jgi:plasmid stabilization system protein ParE
MGKAIIWQPRVLEQVRSIIEYFREEIESEQAIENFLDKLDEKSEFISKYPDAGRPSTKKDVKYILIDKNRSLFYRIKKDRILMILLWNSKMNPSKNPYLPIK